MSFISFFHSRHYVSRIQLDCLEVRVCRPGKLNSGRGQGLRRQRCYKEECTLLSSSHKSWLRYLSKESHKHSRVVNKPLLAHVHIDALVHPLYTSASNRSSVSLSCCTVIQKQRKVAGLCTVLFLIPAHTKNEAPYYSYRAAILDR